MLFHDWETDLRPIPQILQEWRANHGWTRAQTAEALRVHPAALNAWFDGSRLPGHESAIRRLMTLIDRRWKSRATPGIELTGSPAQIARAEKIRLAATQHWDEWIEWYADHSEPNWRAEGDRLKLVTDAAAGINSASAWINGGPNPGTVLWLGDPDLFDSIRSHLGMGHTEFVFWARRLVERTPAQRTADTRESGKRRLDSTDDE